MWSQPQSILLLVCTFIFLRFKFLSEVCLILPIPLHFSIKLFSLCTTVAILQLLLLKKGLWYVLFWLIVVVDVFFNP